MDISIRNRTGEEEIAGIALEASLEMDDLEQLKALAQRALEIEQALPPDARTFQGSVDEAIYASDFIRTRVANDALESYGIIPIARPQIRVSGLSSGNLYKCSINALPRPNIGLTSLDPVNLRASRIPKPGVSTREAQSSEDESAYLDDEKTLRITLSKRLDSEFSEPEMRALGEEYQNAFESKLAMHNISVEEFQASHGLNEEQYAIMMTRRALDNAHWNYALDAVFVGQGLALVEDDVLAELESEHPGHAKALLELHELRNDLYLIVEKARRSKALRWLRENAIA